MFIYLEKKNTWNKVPIKITIVYLLTKIIIISRTAMKIYNQSLKLQSK